jgi:aminopeptidase YwaD
MKPPVLFFLASCALLAGCSPTSHGIRSGSITADGVREHIRYLASDELKGRKSGEEGNRLAAEYIARHFEEDGLLPVGDDGSYFQHFTFVSTTKVGEKNTLTASVNGTALAYTLEKSFRPLGFSVDTALTAPVVFAGYGIAAADSLKYNDYAGIDVKNKVVVVLRYSPDTTADDKFSSYTSLTT